MHQGLVRTWCLQEIVYGTREDDRTSIAPSLDQKVLIALELRKAQCEIFVIAGLLDLADEVFPLSLQI